jgi:putative transposase
MGLQIPCGLHPEVPHVARTFFDQKRNFVGAHFWARGDFVSTVGRDEATVREYIRNQEAEDKRLEQLRLP